MARTTLQIDVERPPRGGSRRPAGSGGNGFLKSISKILVALAAAMLLVLLWKLRPAAVWTRLRLVGWGMALVLAQQIVPLALDAFGWRWSFGPEDGAPPFWELLRLRIAGDGVNLLTPSATIGGEFVRAAALRGGRPLPSDYSSVAVAKFAQSLGQALYVLAGLAFMLTRGEAFFAVKLSWLRPATELLAGTLAVLAAAGFLVWRRLPSRREPEQAASSWLGVLKDTPRRCLEFVHLHPWRFAAAVSFFITAYAWTTFEAWWICLCLGVPVSLAAAAAIEILSNVVHGVFFMVPGRIGTQEAGQTAIFAALGLGAGAGFAFGVVRHVRELIWAGFGLFLCPVKEPR